MSSVDPDLAEIRRYLAAKRYDVAALALKDVLAKRPRDPWANLIQAGLELRADHYRRAHAHTILASVSPPPEFEFEIELFQRLRTFNEHAAMVECARRVLDRRWFECNRFMQMASTLLAIGASELAETMLARMKSSAPKHLATLMTEGYLATNLGQFERAELVLEDAIAREPRLAMAHWLLARLRTQTDSSNHVSRLRRVLADRSLTLADRAQIEFALHKELHDLGDFAAAWEVLVAACAHKRALTPYDEAAMMTLFDAIEAAPIGRVAEAVDDGPKPIFIVGMHRSGTTLLERILGRHPRVVDCGETYRFTAQLREAADHLCKGVVDLKIIQAASQFDYQAIAKGYLESCRWRLPDGATHYTEKLPSNFLLVGLIKQALPQAKILHIRREPMDTCLSNLRELFSEACAYSYDQGELGRYYLRYERLMAHWHRRFPGEILDVQYEDLVTNPEVEARRVFDFCGLDWRDEVIDVTGHPGPVNTASAVQVRSPIHRRSIGGWRVYQTHLAPLRELLDR